ncbi:hypothetical protein DL93DRAFT_155321 [Clavulina sp. PMI_390]|nr:hypothetical protein DL93DRAFT_155321 [Clavulina sp. PMI_390]
MKPISLFAFAATLAVQCLNVNAAPVGVVVVTHINGKESRVLVPVADDETDPENIRNIIKPLIFPLPPTTESDKLKEGAKDLFWIAGGAPGIQAPPPHIIDGPHPHPHGVHLLPPQLNGKKPCGQKTGRVHGFKAAMAHKMHRLMNRLRAMFGLPPVKFHHVHLAHHGHKEEMGVKVLEAGDAPHPHPHHHHHHGQEQRTSDAFWPRFVHAMQSLGPWEGRAVTFVVGLGIGSLIRMVVVLIILAVRGRKAFKNGRCARARAARAARRAARRGATAEEVEALIAPPPAYTSGSAPAPEKKTPLKTLKDILTVQYTEGALIVVWSERDSAEIHSTPASEFHGMYPQELIKFYESNLKWKAEEVHETHQ